MKLYVWFDKYPYEPTGVFFAYAENISQAWEMLKKFDDYKYDDFRERGIQPQVHTKPYCNGEWGGW